jgi:hypothetical protein
VAESVLAPGARIACRSAEWLVRRLGRSSDGRLVVDVVGVSSFLLEKQARLLVEVEKAAGSFKLLRPEDTAPVADPSPLCRATANCVLPPGCSADKEVWGRHAPGVTPRPGTAVAPARYTLITANPSWPWPPRRASACAPPISGSIPIRRPHLSVDPQQLQHAVDLRHQRLHLKHIARLLRAPFSTIARDLTRLGLERLRNLEP